MAQFQTEDRAKQFQDDFKSLVEADEPGGITGPALAGVIADDLEMGSQWQMMDEPSLEQLKAGEWTVAHPADAWQPRLDEVSPNHSIDAADLDMDL